MASRFTGSCLFLDLVLEQLVGIEMLKIYRLGDNPDMIRRLLVGKWLYIRGHLLLPFQQYMYIINYNSNTTVGAFDDTFPHEKLFVPGHLRDEDDD